MAIAPVASSQCLPTAVPTGRWWRHYDACRSMVDGQRSFDNTAQHRYCQAVSRSSGQLCVHRHPSAVGPTILPASFSDTFKTADQCDSLVTLITTANGVAETYFEACDDHQAARCRGAMCGGQAQGRRVCDFQCRHVCMVPSAATYSLGCSLVENGSAGPIARQLGDY
jgi:hypothetical protein